MGARRVFAAGVGLFVVASAALRSRADPGDARRRPVRAGLGGGGDDAGVDGADRPGLPRPSGRGRGPSAMWAMGGAIASSSGPVLGGVLTLVSWRLIFFINVPVGVAALVLLRARGAVGRGGRSRSTGPGR